jgi:hypothetical protein
MEPVSLERFEGEVYMVQHGTAKVDLAKIPLFDGIDSALTRSATLSLA